MLKKVDSSEIERRYRVFSDQFKNGFPEGVSSDQGLKFQSQDSYKYLDEYLAKNRNRVNNHFQSTYGQEESTGMTRESQDDQVNRKVVDNEIYNTATASSTRL